MEIFYSSEILDGFLRLDAGESAHCTQVLRHKAGDAIDVIDGRGTLYRCTLVEEDSPGPAATASGASFPAATGNLRKSYKRRAPAAALARIDSVVPGWGGHPYRLTLAVCPTKNPDRYEWMAEKATEVSLDLLVPVIGERSERRVLKTDRLERILLSAAKQSLKGAVPEVAEPLGVREFVAGMGVPAADELRLIAYCSDEVQPRSSIMAELRAFVSGVHAEKPRITVLIGPEGDFSPEEVRAAMAAGFVPVSLGASRLRTETAGLTAAEAVYLTWL